MRDQLRSDPRCGLAFIDESGEVGHSSNCDVGRKNIGDFGSGVSGFRYVG